MPLSSPSFRNADIVLHYTVLSMKVAIILFITSNSVFIAALVLESMQKMFISNEENFTKDEIVKTIKEIARNLGIKIPAIMKLVRLTISGLRVSISLF